MTADETNAPINDSNKPHPAPKSSLPPGPPFQTEGDSEPVILEERVVKVAKPKPKAPPPAPAKPPVPVPEVPVEVALPKPPPAQVIPELDSEPVEPPPSPPPPHEARAIPQLVVPKPNPNFRPTILSDGMDILAVENSTDVPLPEKIESMMPQKPEKPTGDLPHILESVKLPERRAFKASAEPKKIIENIPAEEKPVPAASPASDETTSSIVSPLRTLRNDLQSIVRDQKISLVRAASLEQEKKRGQAHLTPEQTEIRAHRSKRTLGILFFSGLFILLGVGAFFGVFYVAQRQAAVPAPPQGSILFAEQTSAFSLDNQTAQNLKAQLAEARTAQLGSLGSITRIVPTIMATSSDGSSHESVATLQQFFAALGMNPPPELLDAIGPQFFFGFHVVDTNAPLFVIPVTSYDHAFAGMLAWEPTMDQDLAPIFTAVPATIDVNGIPQQRTFQDQVLRNYDVRELTDDQGNVVLYYSFPTPNILIIAQSPYSFTEILSRLQAAREL